MGRRRTSDFDIASNNTFERSEMQCPTCFQYSLIPDPDRVHEFSGERDKVVYATLCGNASCNTGRIKPDSIRLQMPKGSKLTQWAKREGVLSVAIVVLIVGAAVLTALFTLGFVGPEATTTVEGQILTETGDPVSNAAVTLDGQTVGTDEQGRFILEGVGPGVHGLVVEPAAESSVGAIPPVSVVVEDGEYSVQQSETVVRGEDSLNVFLPPIESVSARTVSANTSVDISFATTVNANRGVTVMLRGQEPTTTETRVVVESGETVVVDSFGVPERSRTAVTVPPTEQPVTYADTYTGPETIPLEGNLAPRDFRVTFPDGAAPSVSVNRELVCTAAEVEAAGRCDIPADVVLDSGAAPTLSFGSGEGVAYEFTYTSRTVAERVFITVDGEDQRVVERSEGSPLPSGGWEYQGPLGVGLEQGSQSVTVRAVTPVGEVVEGAVVVQFDQTVVPPTTPRVTVVNAAGEEFSTTVPAERLDDGKLVSTYVLTVPAEWFSAGENTIRVSSANGQVVEVEVEAFSTVEQEPAFR